MSFLVAFVTYFHDPIRLHFSELLIWCAVFLHTILQGSCPKYSFKKKLSLFLADLDGKLYDAYVAYPSPCSSGYNEEVENFAINTLPQVLEKACGYKLFIAGRDCLPGQGNTPTLGLILNIWHMYTLLHSLLSGPELITCQHSSVLPCSYGGLSRTELASKSQIHAPLQRIHLLHKKTQQQQQQQHHLQGQHHQRQHGEQQHRLHLWGHWHVCRAKAAVWDCCRDAQSPTGGISEGERSLCLLSILVFFRYTLIRFFLISFPGDSSRAGRNQPSPVGPFPRVAASPQEKAGCCVLVEEPETKATMPDMYKWDRGREDRQK